MRILVMNLCSEHGKVLIHRLEMKGMEKNEILGFIWSLKSCLLDNQDMDHLQANKKLHFLGWNDFDLDYQTLQLAISCFEGGDLKRTEKFYS